MIYKIKKPDKLSGFFVEFYTSGVNQNENKKISNFIFDKNIVIFLIYLQRLNIIVK